MNWIMSRTMPRKPGINIGLISHIGVWQTLLTKAWMPNFGTSKTSAYRTTNTVRRTVFSNVVETNKKIETNFPDPCSFQAVPMLSHPWRPSTSALNHSSRKFRMESWSTLRRLGQIRRHFQTMVTLNILLLTMCHVCTLPSSLISVLVNHVNSDFLRIIPHS